MITDRQAKILAAIVEQYAKTAQPVGSLVLSEYFDVSPATIRSEMSQLEYAGYIMQPHTSAGRVPTDSGYRYHVDKLVDKSELKPTRAGRALKRRVMSAGEAQQAIKSAVDSLVEITGNVGLAMLGNNFYMSGLSHLFSQPEFTTGEVYETAALLDNIEPWLREVAPDERLNIYIGRENPIGKSSGCTLIVSRFKSPFSDHSYVGVVGPTRQDYTKSMRVVERAGDVLEEVMS